MAKIDWNDPEEVKEYKHQCYLKNREKALNAAKEYRKEHNDEIYSKRKDYFKEYQNENKDKLRNYLKEYRKTKIGRAVYLCDNYRREDKLHGLGECTLTPEWIVENIFSGQKCVYCGEDDWTKLGCDRIDNDKPHTPDNVVCSCWECNNKRKNTDFNEFIKTR